MGENVKEINKYSLPYKVNSSLKWYRHLLYALMAVVFIGIAFIPIEDNKLVIVYKLICGFFGLFLGYIWFYSGVLKKQYLELTEEHIKYKTVFGTKKAKWIEIYDIQVYTQSHNTMLGIVLKEKMRKRKDSFKTLLSDLFGGKYSIAISFMLFPNTNFEQLYTTIVDKLVEVNKDASLNVEDNVDSYQVKDEEDGTNSYPIALIKSILLSILIGIGYGLSIYFFKCNIVIIPIIGTIAIVYTYLKNYKEEKINILLRIIIGIVCVIQVFAAVITAIFLSTKIPLNLGTFKYVVDEYFKDLLANTADQGYIIIIAVICFFMGAVQNHTFKIEKIFKKKFMKKINNIYYKKEGRIVTIYLKDPVLYNEDEEGKLFSQINEGCIIEKKNNKVKGFYIPNSFVEELGVSLGSMQTTLIDNISFYKVDLGSGGTLYSYAYPCVLILNSNKQVELMQIQL
ncbi:hypothetical protein [Clostridium omnivorum]|uniref:PH domain-containing protein n=1 Tax=Clostridium omnivorum TaxID=1604902 RepID=A0ABQ5N5J5_9CLOT|nr:hypothetical protein [Clostridium sp. E14]GLC30384.1 hypothetical protein bsdE14_17940 [Clostridium sp. E14]